MAAITASLSGLPLAARSHAASHRRMAASPVPPRRGRSLTTSVKAFREDPRDPIQPKFQDKYVAQDEYMDSSIDTREALQRLQDRWDRVEDKKTAVALIAGVVVGTWLSGGLLSTIDRLPIIPNLLTFIGLLYSGNFFWRYVLFKNGREELRGSLRELYANLRDAVEGTTGPSSLGTSTTGSSNNFTTTTPITTPTSSSSSSSSSISSHPLGDITGQINDEDEGAPGLRPNPEQNANQPLPPWNTPAATPRGFGNNKTNRK